jgi:hypothetical protein
MASGQVCLQRTEDVNSEDDIGLTATAQAGLGPYVGIGDVSRVHAVEVSNANTLYGLKSWFWFGSATVGPLTFTIFWNGLTGSTGKGKAIYGADITATPTLIGGGVILGRSYTGLLQFTSGVDADPARWLYNGIAGPFLKLIDVAGGIPSILRFAKSEIHKFSQRGLEGS